MASNSNGKNLKTTNDVLNISLDADLWNGAIGIFFGSTHDGTKLVASGGTGIASDGTMQLEVGCEPPGNIVGNDPTSPLIIDWIPIKVYNANSDAKVATVAPAGTAVYCWAELVGIKFARIRKTDTTTNGTWVRIAQRRG